MQTCEKCGSNKIQGPTYNAALDELDYRCWTCGYKWSGPTKGKRLVDPKDLLSRPFKLA